MSRQPELRGEPPEKRMRRFHGGLDAQPAHAAQVPTISRVWERSEKPCSEAIAEVQRSTAGPSTSTVAPQDRQTR